MTGWRVKENDVITCPTCGRVELKRGHLHVYCKTCSAARDHDRKTRWSRENPQKPASPAVIKEREERRKRIGSAVSKEAARGIDWMADEIEGSARRLVRVAVPFDWRYSKNAIYRVGQGGHVFIREGVNKIRDDLASAFKQAGGEWFEGKVWLDVLVQKPSNKGDAVNVVDLVCDAVKVGIGVDDRWFSIARLDWEIEKTNPRIFVGVSQDVTEHQRICACCGQTMPLADYSKNRSDRMGHARECRPCSSALKSEAKRRRQEMPA